MQWTKINIAIQSQKDGGPDIRAAAASQLAV
jgi:hypothetical protein